MATTDKTRLNGQYRRSKPTTLAEQPQCTSQTSTSGPLIRERVIYYTMRATLQPTNRLPTQTIPQEKTPRHFRRIQRNISPKSFPTHHILLTSYSQGSILSKSKYGRQTSHDNHSYLHLYQKWSPQTQSTRTSTSQIVAWPNQTNPLHIFSETR